MRVLSEHITKIKNWGFYQGFADYKEFKSYDLSFKSPNDFIYLPPLIKICINTVAVQSLFHYYSFVKSTEYAIYTQPTIFFHNPFSYGNYPRSVNYSFLLNMDKRMDVQTQGVQDYELNITVSLLSERHLKGHIQRTICHLFI